MCDLQDRNKLEEFVYLGLLITADNDTSNEVRIRILVSNCAYFGYNNSSLLSC